MAVARGSLVMVDYTARIKDGAIFDTTREPDGKKAGLDSDKKYGPVLVSVGDRWVLEGFDDALDGAEEGKDISVEVPPAKGFGEVSYSKIRVMRSRKLGDDEEKVSVGDEVQIDGRRGVIRLMASGRIKVDFNHKYAGKTLVYEARVARVLESDGDKISAILERHFDGAGHDYSEGMLVVDVREREGLSSAKHAARAELFRLVPSIEAIKYVETHRRPGAVQAAEAGPPPEQAAAPEPAPAEASPVPEPAPAQMPASGPAEHPPGTLLKCRDCGRLFRAGEEEGHESAEPAGERPPAPAPRPAAQAGGYLVKCGECGSVSRPKDDEPGVESWRPSGEAGQKDEPGEGVESWRPGDDKD